MLLRNHPKLKWKGNNAWPPLVWASAAPQALASIRDIENCILVRAILKSNADQEKYLELAVIYDDRYHHTAFRIDDPEYLSVLLEVFNRAIGKAIGEIGNLNIGAEQAGLSAPQPDSGSLPPGT